MSPAGHWPQLHAAVEAGADAVYFGLNHFSARAKVGFELSELPMVMRSLHHRAVKGFVTFNTLVFDHELSLAETTLRQISDAGVDAVIVQDVGIAKMAKEIVPELEVHGSTQMSITSAEGAQLAKQLGCSRVVLGRELSLADIRRIAAKTDVELETFVHGALCVSYSGQCFSSEAWGGRSANRGKCAQACRLSYDLIVDGKQRDLGPYRYLLSPGDLYAIEQVPELVEIGIACLKIEGRYKDADYVAMTTRAYREAIDLACMGLPNEVEPEERDDIEQIYSRGLGPHFMSGIDHQKVVIGRAPRHRGLNVGVVSEVGKSYVNVAWTKEISAGDGLVFDAANWRSPDEPEEGGNVYQVKTMGPESGASVQLRFGHGEIDFSRIRVGDLVWRTKDPQLAKKLKSITNAGKPLFTRRMSFKVTASIGRPLEILALTEQDETALFVSETPLEAAAKRALDLSTLQEKLGRLGGTPFHLGDVVLDTKDPVFVPTSLLNQARRELVERILEQREQVNQGRPSGGQFKIQQFAPTAKDTKHSLETDSLDSETSKTPAKGVDAPRLHLLVRTAEQLDAAIESRPQSITLDYLELYGLKPSVRKIKEAGLVARVASPRILKPSEQNVIRFLLSLECEIVVRSGGLLYDLLQQDTSLPPLIGDFSLNAANRIAFATYLEMGLTRIAPTYDLNSKQIEDLTTAIPASKIEVIAYSHLPVFHTEHCVFCRFLSDGTDNTNCGHPCETHRIAVRDAQGRAHPVMADVGCRNTVFGAEAQTNAESIQIWADQGIRDFRVEVVHQTAEQVVTLSEAFQRFLADKISSAEFSKRINEASPQQTTEGSLFVPKDFGNLVQLGSLER